MLYVLGGPSGAGKLKLAKDYFKDNKVVTYTTRQKRDGEVEGVDYKFIPKFKFDRLKDKGFFYETTEYVGDCYGTSNISLLMGIRNNSYLILDINGYRKLKSDFPNDVVGIYVTNSKDNILSNIDDKDYSIYDRIGRILVGNSYKDYQSEYKYKIDISQYSNTGALEELDKILKD